MTFCSFCGKAQNESRKMIAGPSGVHICDACVAVCKTIIERETSDELASQQAKEARDPNKSPFDLKKPAT